MRKPNCHRYFLCFRPNRSLRRFIYACGSDAGLERSRVAEENLHITLMNLGEPIDRDPFMLARVNAVLGDHDLAATWVHLGRLRVTGSGAALYTRGRKAELFAFRATLLALFGSRGIFPSRGPQMFDPHVSLAHAGHNPLSSDLRLPWLPDAIYLIESLDGLGVHNILGQWPLKPPSQGEFEWMAHNDLDGPPPCAQAA